MKRFVSALVIFCLGLYLYFIFPYQFNYNPLAQHDIKNWCEITRSFDWGDLTNPTVQEEKEFIYWESVINALWTTSAKNIWKGLRVVDQGQRWEVIQRGAREVGLVPFDCPSLKNYFERKPMSF